MTILQERFNGIPIQIVYLFNHFKGSEALLIINNGRKSSQEWWSYAWPRNKKYKNINPSKKERCDALLQKYSEVECFRYLQQVRSVTSVNKKFKFVLVIFSNFIYSIEWLVNEWWKLNFNYEFINNIAILFIINELISITIVMCSSEAANRNDKWIFLNLFWYFALTLIKINVLATNR